MFDAMPDDCLPHIIFDHWEAHRLPALRAAITHKDPDTFGHCTRVAALSVELGEALGLDARARQILRVGAELHDVGKTDIPSGILLKPGKLNDDERRIMNTHSALGAQIILACTDPIGEEIALVVRHHHEHYDGSGYPDGLASMEIPYLARIVAIADCYDALTMDRPYRAPFSHARAMHIMCEERGTTLDPNLVDRFGIVIADSPHRAAQDLNSAATRLASAFTR